MKKNTLNEDLKDKICNVLFPKINSLQKELLDISDKIVLYKNSDPNSNSFSNILRVFSRYISKEC